jgi:hypothetical protein
MFNPGDLVVLFPSPTVVVGQCAPLLGGGGTPLVGRIEQVVGTVVTVVWGNGLTTDYDDNGDQLFLQSGTQPSTIAALHTRKTVAAAFNGPANPRGQGASEGLVIGIFAAVVGITTIDYMVLKFSAGDIAIVEAAGVV